MRLEGHAGIFITDITFRRTVLYGISFTALYRLNAATGARRRVGPLGLDGANALATQPGTGVLYGASHQGELFTISTRTGRASLVGAFGHRLGSAGDLTFARGQALRDRVEAGLAPVVPRHGEPADGHGHDYRNDWLQQGLGAGHRVARTVRGDGEWLLPGHLADHGAGQGDLERRPSHQRAGGAVAVARRGAWARARARGPGPGPGPEPETCERIPDWLLNEYQSGVIYL